MVDTTRMRAAVDADRRLGHVLLWALLVAALIVLLQPWSFEAWHDGHPTLLWLGRHRFPAIVFAVLVAWLGRRAYRPAQVAGATALSEAGPELLGKYDAATLRRVFDEVVERLGAGHRERPSLYLVRSAEGNAASMNSYFLNGSASKNAVFVGSFFLRTVSVDELRALLGHEVEHFYRCQNPLARAPYAVGGAVATLVLGAAAAVFDESGWVFRVSGTMLFLVPTFLATLTAVLRFARRRSHEHELLADLAGAEASSPEAMINLLLQLGARQEIVFRALEEAVRRIEENPEVNPAAVMKLVSEALPDDPLDEATARRLVAETISARHPTNSEDRKEQRALSKSRATIVKKLAEVFGRDEAWRVLSWQLFDSRVPDGRLDAAEIRDLLVSLEKDQDAMLFAVSPDRAGPPRPLEHPTFRRRVLFVAQATGLHAS